jgi:actin related protein 2/3 complex subunit 1A/1B
MASEHQLTSQAEGISCFAWNADHSMIAVCPNNNEIDIYGVQKQSETWQKIFTLIEVHLLYAKKSLE